MCFFSQSLKVLNCGAVASRVTLISWVLETIILQTFSVRMTKKYWFIWREDLKCWEIRLFIQVHGEIPAGALWSSHIQNWVMVYPARLLSFPLYLPLAVIGSISLVHPSVPLGPPPGCAAESGFALAPLPPLTAAGLPQPLGHPKCKLAEIALIQGSSLSSFTLHFTGSASTTEISSQDAYCCQKNAGFNNSNFKALAVPIATPQLSPKNFC